MLKLNDIHVYRGQTYVLKGVSLEVGRGEIVALIGANGAGKTTTLRTISGLLTPKNGSIIYTPEKDDPPWDISGAQAEDIVARGIAHCPEGRGVFAQLSVRENLMVGAYLRNDKKQIEYDHERVCHMFPILGERANQAAGSLSGGEQAMLAVGRALMTRPRLLILDEPSLGLAPLVVEFIFDMLAEINSQGVTVLLVEQNAVMALKLANRAYVLENGQVTLSGPSDELARDEKVRRAYLGGE
ncbi:ABC transporter ATP-binding protein [Dethiosulfatarculus sandiegensis]|uniref:Amino acid ABC transporter ATPase n=1 Tax=Dethiosulfatarculus sandiegensis TaxID=1429043 RepID=A0A0D2HPK1_9BACT|nr:ABC transporter ATP-binding protein [Dethiosulfatarculus sandiegensis]KIX12428.1 amino acid ABC transporter ATPase [Dethiosulfatarculus sandiegensis]